MTHIRRWSSAYLSTLRKIPDEWLVNRIRSTTTLLAGNPYMEPSIPVEGSIRAIDVENTAVLLYEIGPGAILMFLSVDMYDPQAQIGAPRETARKVLAELRESI